MQDLFRQITDYKRCEHWRENLVLTALAAVISSLAVSCWYRVLVF